MSFRVKYLEGAREELGQIDPRTELRIRAKIESVLAINPHPHGNVVRRISGVSPPLSRIRIGDWRAFFIIDAGEVLVASVVKKEKAERTIRRLRR